MRVILIHGFNVKAPAQTVGKLAEPLREAGVPVYMFNYGRTSLITARIRNFALAKKLARKIREYQDQGQKVVVIGHSNGCTIMRLACTRYKAAPEGVICINPALKRDIHPAPGARVHVYHNEQDKVVTWAKWLRRFTFCKARPWGEMGRYGYLGDAVEVENYCTAHDFDVPALGHSGIFDDDNIFYYSTMLIASVRRLLEQSGRYSQRGT